MEKLKLEKFGVYSWDRNNICGQSGNNGLKQGKNQSPATKPLNIFWKDFCNSGNK